MSLYILSIIRLDLTSRLHFTSDPARPHAHTIHRFAAGCCNALTLLRFYDSAPPPTSCSSFVCNRSKEKKEKKIEHNNFSDCETKKLSLGYFRNSRERRRGQLYIRWVMAARFVGSFRWEPMREFTRKSEFSALCCLPLSRRRADSKSVAGILVEDGASFIRRRRFTKKRKKRGERRYRAENMPIYSTHSMPTLCVCNVHNKMIFFP